MKSVDVNNQKHYSKEEMLFMYNDGRITKRKVKEYLGLPTSDVDDVFKIKISQEGSKLKAALMERREGGVKVRLEERVMELEKRVTDLEEQVQDRSAIEFFLNRLAAISSEASYKLSCNLRVVCECGRTKHYKKANFCASCGRKLNRLMG